MATISFERNVVIDDAKKIEEIQKRLEQPTLLFPYHEKDFTEEQKVKIKKWFCR